MANLFNQSLTNDDLELKNLIDQEYERQNYSIELIASENFTSSGVLECLGSVLTNKYSEGYPDKRYYGGNQIIDKIELLCMKRALTAFNLNDNEWTVNVQPYSGSPANFAIYTGLLNPGDRIMGLGLTSGGHLTHGFYTSKKKISASSIFFQSLPYGLNKEGLIDYEELEKISQLYLPKIIIAGGSSYPRDYDYQRLKKICDSVGCYFMVDMAHFSGLVATKLVNNPFDYADIVSTTTHKTLRGPRSGLIFINKKKENGTLVQKINEAVFPGLQGGPHNHQIAAVAFQLNEVIKPEFTEYMKKVQNMAKYLAESLIKKGFEIMTGGTDTHLILVNLKNKDITGSKMEYLCELVDISLNKNCIYGDKNAISPSGIRIGTPAMVSRGFDKNEFEQIAIFLDKLIAIGNTVQTNIHINTGSKLLEDFKKGLQDPVIMEEILKIKKDVNELASKFPFYKK